MATGDIVEYKEHHYKVLKEDAGLRTVTLQSWDASTVEVADDDPEITKRTSLERWPFLQASSAVYRGQRPLKLVRSVRRPGGLQAVELEPFRDWSPTDILRVGGPIFINPSLKLMPGETLVLHYSDGKSVRLTVTRKFGSAVARRARLIKETPKDEQKTIYDHLEDDF